MTKAMARRQSKVTAITPHLHWGFSVGPSHRTEYLKLLPRLGVTLVPLTTLAAVRDGCALVRNLSTEEERLIEFDFIVSGSMPAPQVTLFEALSSIAPCANIGDSLAPRSAMEAIREGDKIGRSIRRSFRSGRSRRPSVAGSHVDTSISPVSIKVTPATSSRRRAPMLASQA